MSSRSVLRPLTGFATLYSFLRCLQQKATLKQCGLHRLGRARSRVCGGRSSGVTTASSGACCLHPFLTNPVFSDTRLKLTISHGKTIYTTEIGKCFTRPLCYPNPLSQLLNISLYTAASPLQKHYSRWLGLAVAFRIEDAFGSRGPWWMGKDRKESPLKLAVVFAWGRRDKGS